MEPHRPILRWHGGKWLLAPWVLSFFPEHRVYTEAFGGAASVLLRKRRSYAEVYNDLDGEVVNLFRVARDRGEELIAALRLTPFARDEFSSSYLPTNDPLEQARRTVVRSFMGFGSSAHTKATGFRANSNRSGTTPVHDWANYPEALALIADRLRGVCIENRPAVDVITHHDSPDTLHYIDPPYVKSTRDSGTDYNFEMVDYEHEQLAKVLNRVRGMVIVSGYDSELYRDIYAGWHLVTKQAFADGARIRTECLWLNEAAMSRQAQLSLW